jgi:hypothetical protein
LITLQRAPEIGELLSDLEELKKKISDRSGDVPGAGTAPGMQSPLPLPRPVHEQRSPGRANDTTAVPTIPESEIASRWAEFIGEVRRQRISLGSVLESARFLGVRGTTIRIGCVNDFQMSAVTRNKEFLSEILNTVLHVHARVEPELVDEQQSASGAGVSHTAPAEDHPVIAAMRRELGAEPVD